MQDMYLRAVEEKDMEKLFEWRNDEACRRNFFSSDVVEFNTHKIWFEKMMADENEKAFILMGNGKRIGQIRLTLEENKGDISYCIDLHYRGKGYGKIILELLEEKIRQECQNLTLVGLVKKQNKPSQCVFKSLNYKCKDENDVVVFYKKIK